MDVFMPKLGLTMEEGTIGRWVVENGQRVNLGETICEIETDKVTEELEAEAEGVLRQAVPAGATVAVGVVIGYIE
jgi:2-oxoglutarate dehydrogenase E2 component (dihydrolipoamide succinyltransferase)